MERRPINPWSWSIKLGFDQALANIVRLNVYTTNVNELFKHFARIPERFGNSDSRFATTVLGVARLAAPQLLVLLEATAVD